MDQLGRSPFGSMATSAIMDGFQARGGMGKPLPGSTATSLSVPGGIGVVWGVEL